MENQLVIGAASVYNRNYYFNPVYNGMPKEIKEEIREICVCFAEKLHCVFMMKFDEEGNVCFEATADETDYNYDEIGAKLDIDKLMRDKKELLKSLSLWYRVFMTEEGRQAFNKMVEENKGSEE